MKILIIIGLLASSAWAADFSQMSTEEGQSMGKKGMYKNQPTFAEYDLNNDGKITPKELEEGRAKRMKQKAEEGRMMRNADKAPPFTDLDSNKDGTISPKEFRSYKIKHPQGCITFG